MPFSRAAVSQARPYPIFARQSSPFHQSIGWLVVMELVDAAGYTHTAITLRSSVMPRIFTISRVLTGRYIHYDNTSNPPKDTRAASSDVSARWGSLLMISRFLSNAFLPLQVAVAVVKYHCHGHTSMVSSTCEPEVREKPVKTV